MTDPLAPYNAGSDPLAPPPATPPASAVPVPEPKSVMEPRPAAPLEDAKPRVARPGTSRPDGPPASPGASVHEANVVDLPPLPRKRSLLWRIVSFSWELTIGVTIALVILVAGGVFYVVDWAKSLGPTYSAAELYEDGRYSMTVKDGDKVILDTYLDQVGAWDHDGCDSIATDKAVQSAVVEAGCEFGIEGVYERADLHYTIYQRILEFPDAGAAKRGGQALGDAEELPGKVSFSVEMPEDGKTGAVVDVEGRFVIFTVAAIEPEGEKNLAEAEEAIDALHTEHLNVLVWQD
ncbi:hypothetical protein [Stackebrandtia nassauensis]|uniref:Uncharacterized protein n=1 Tax=Stackebrandtia nassauensis (strain DSM 44728 / CIP 108903 / NRRL B-16338 / NBRC 102104 / LLR-40K-21) TaxID=446470 RepID=D3Q5T2_STANL|nr:hypothetical protein [Stackebrandtia nassauensis]ADD40231.1 hypothetical protein Snas_0516 [Stackebrandtia nassauensis DSM 44728]